MSNERKYRLKKNEPLPEGMARVARGRIDDAIDELSGATDSTSEEAVHNARKDLKKLRALLRVARGELGKSVYRRENASFRDAAAALAGLRDADVMLVTLEKLELDEELSGPLRQSLEAHRLRTGGGGREQAGGEAIEILSEARARIVDWPLEDDGFAAVEPGLRRTYRGGRREWRAMQKEPTVEGLHQWRKRVKELWYDHELLRPLWKPVMKAVGDEAHELSDLLGDDHDLAVLLDWARNHADAPPELADAVEKRRRDLQEQAFELGARLYADRPKVFIRRLERLYDASRERATVSS